MLGEKKRLKLIGNLFLGASLSFFLGFDANASRYENPTIDAIKGEYTARQAGAGFSEAGLHAVLISPKVAICASHIIPEDILSNNHPQSAITFYAQQRKILSVLRLPNADVGGRDLALLLLDRNIDNVAYPKIYGWDDEDVSRCFGQWGTSFSRANIYRRNSTVRLFPQNTQTHMARIYIGFSLEDELYVGMPDERPQGPFGNGQIEDHRKAIPVSGDSGSALYFFHNNSLRLLGLLTRAHSIEELNPAAQTASYALPCLHKDFINYQLQAVYRTGRFGAAIQPRLMQPQLQQNREVHQENIRRAESLAGLLSLLPNHVSARISGLVATVDPSQKIQYINMLRNLWETTAAGDRINVLDALLARGDVNFADLQRIMSTLNGVRSGGDRLRIVNPGFQSRREQDVMRAHGAEMSNHERNRWNERAQIREYYLADMRGADALVQARGVLNQRFLPTPAQVDSSINEVFALIRQYQNNSAMNETFRRVSRVEFPQCQDERRNALMALQDQSPAAHNFPALLTDPDMRVLLAQVWREIILFQDLLNQNNTASQRATMQISLVKALGQCIEDDGHRICHPGKTRRLLTVLQGYIPGIHIDNLDNPSVVDFKASFENELFRTLNETMPDLSDLIVMQTRNPGYTDREFNRDIGRVRQEFMRRVNSAYPANSPQIGELARLMDASINEWREIDK
ncbi:MAG: hypothetical protein KBB83_01980 [Alphaproteobacteria bacterium]|nr:hypothetical protein [Alphaproteobacteria bacterium]